jgi:hypothetical protein
MRSWVGCRVQLYTALVRVLLGWIPDTTFHSRRLLLHFAKKNAVHFLLSRQYVRVPCKQRTPPGSECNPTRGAWGWTASGRDAWELGAACWGTWRRGGSGTKREFQLT